MKTATIMDWQLQAANSESIARELMAIYCLLTTGSSIKLRFKTSGVQICGSVFDRRGFKDGDYIKTSNVVYWQIKPLSNGWLVRTRHGSRYFLPKDDMNADQRRALDDSISKLSLK